jgi:translation initiation factor IF-1
MPAFNRPEEICPAPTRPIACRRGLLFQGIQGIFRLSSLIENKSKDCMSNEPPIQVEGTITTVLPGTMFRVKLDNQHEILGHISGKMRKHFVRLTAGDRVRLEMSPYDLTKARITYRLR